MEEVLGLFGGRDKPLGQYTGTLGLVLEDSEIESRWRNGRMILSNFARFLVIGADGSSLAARFLETLDAQVFSGWPVKP
jgi:hypothetical protein